MPEDGLNIRRLYQLRAAAEETFSGDFLDLEREG